MKPKSIIIILILIFNLSILSGQIPYYDALKLSHLKWEIDPEENVLMLLEDTGSVEFNLALGTILNYFPEETPEIEVIQKISENPFFRFPIEVSQSIKQKSDKSLLNNKKNLELGLNKISGLDVTNFAYDLSEFLVERAKEELTIAFFNRFKRFLEDNPESKVLFPETSTYLETLLAHDYTTWLPTVQEKFLKDIEQVFFKFDDLLEIQKYDYIRNSIPEVMICLKSMEIIHNNSVDNENPKHPAKIIDTIAQLNYWRQLINKESKNIRGVYQSTNLISQSLWYSNKQDTILTDTNYIIVQYNNCLVKEFSDSTMVSDTLTNWESDSKGWITKQHMELLLDNDTAFKIYVGLLYQEAITNPIDFYQSNFKTSIVRDSITLPKGTMLAKNSITYTKNNKNKTIENNFSLDKTSTFYRGSVVKYKKESISFAEILENYKSEIIQLHALFNSFNGITNKFEEAKDSLQYKKKNNISISQKEYKRYLSASFSTINFGFDLVDFFGFIEQKNMKEYIKLNTQLEDVVLKVYGHEYSSAMLGASHLIETVSGIINTNLNHKTKFTEQYDNLVANYVTLTDGKEKKTKKILLSDYGIKEPEKVKKISKDLVKYAGKVFYYGSFMAKIVEAENSDEVKTILVSTALPAGSSSLKKYNQNNIALNAYVGGIGELSSKPRQFNSSNDWSEIKFNNINCNVYAPIGVTWTFASFARKGSLSGFIGLIDVGAVVNDLLLESDSIDINPNEKIPVSSKITIGDIFSPSFNFVYGFGADIPLAISLGLQWTPGLTKVVDTEFVIKQSYWRFNVALAVDIPMYNLYSGHPVRYTKRKK